MNLLIFFKNIIQIVLSPVNGWKDIEKEDIPVETSIQRGLYPLMAVMLLTVFIRPLYGIMDFNLITLLQIALGQFIALFASLYISKSVMEHFLPTYNSSGENDPIAVGNVATYGTGVMTLIQIIENILPVELTVIQLLPAFAAVCIWKSGKYLDIEREGEIQFMLIAIAALILPVIIINFFMHFLIE
ncbi:MAG: hypothetical protein J1F20_07705 [Muribaculaceae bacterium]|nr:hypothetical protein [Muribaculaceae bacterium]